MSDRNGELSSIGSVVEQIRKQMHERQSDLLRDMSTEYPALRRFLLGGEYGGARWPSGMVTVRVGGGHLMVKLSIRELGVEAGYFGQSASDLKEQIENDLDTESVCWEHDWQTRKEEERWLRKSVRAT